jgi:hypothetical protein
MEASVVLAFMGWNLRSAPGGLATAAEYAAPRGQSAMSFLVPSFTGQAVAAARHSVVERASFVTN